MAIAVASSSPPHLFPESLGQKRKLQSSLGFCSLYILDRADKIKIYRPQRCDGKCSQLLLCAANICSFAPLDCNDQRNFVWNHRAVVWGIQASFSDMPDVSLHAWQRLQAGGIATTVATNICGTLHTFVYLTALESIILCFAVHPLL